MTRIVSGIAAGASLVVPTGPTRPTSERVREAMFSTLDSLGVLADAHVLDLYAGSGALGLEAASRGASEVTLIDSSKPAIAACQHNIDTATQRGIGATLTTEQVSADKWLRRNHGERRWDLVFIDPPYALSNDALVEVLEGLQPLLSKDAMLVVERATRTTEPEFPSGFEVAKVKKYGDTKVWYLWFG